MISPKWENEHGSPIDKSMSVADIAAQIKSGMTIGIGGWGGRRSHDGLDP